MAVKGGGQIFMVPIDLPKCPQLTPEVRSTHTQIRADNDDHIQIYTSTGEKRVVYDESNLPPSLSNPMTSTGSLIIGGENGAPTELPAGNEGNILSMDASGSPAWTDPSTLDIITTIEQEIEGKQDILTAGDGITIENNVISATNEGNMNNPMTARGDVIVGAADGVPESLPIGEPNYALMVSSSGNSLEYGDGSSLPAVIKNTTDIEVLKLQAQAAADLYFTTTLAAPNTPFTNYYAMQPSRPATGEGTLMDFDVGRVESSLLYFVYVFQAVGTIYEKNRYSVTLPLEGLTAGVTYTFKFILYYYNLEADEWTTISEVTTNPFVPTSSTYLIQQELPNSLADNIQYIAHDSLRLEVLAQASVDNSPCSMRLENTSLLALLHREIPTTDLTADNILTTIAGETITQQEYNEQVQTSLANALENPMQSSGDLIMGGTDGTATRLQIGDSGQILQVNASSDALEYVDIPVGSSTTRGVVSVDGVTIQSVAGKLSVIGGTGGSGEATFRYYN